MLLEEFLVPGRALICHAVVKSHNATARVNDGMVKHYEEADKYLLGSGRGGRSHADDSSYGDYV
jgi:hypothetical protein